LSKLTFDILSKFNDAGMQKAGKGFKQLGDDADKAAKRAGKSLDKVGDQAGRAGKDAGKKFGVGFSQSIPGMGGRVSSFFKTTGGKAAGLLGGAAVGAAFIEGFGEALAQGDANAKLKAQLDLSGKDAARAGKIAGDLYKDNYGESVSDVSAVIRKVVQDTNTSINSVNLKPITAQVLSLAGTFDQDFGAVTRGVGQLLRTGLAKDAQKALDVITKGFQEGADKSEDFLDTLNEYGTLFRNMGLTGAKATGLLVQGLQAGARDADKVADAIKEFSIRAVDGTELTADGFKMLGLNADTMASKIGKGGGSASDALDQVLDRLRGIEDPVKRSQAAVALFGTQAEDLGDALFALDPSKAVDSLGKVGGAAKKLDKTIGNTASSTLNGFWRSMKQNVVDGLGAAIQAFQDGKVTADGWIGGMQNIGKIFRGVWDAIGPIVEFAWKHFIGPALEDIGWALGKVSEAAQWLGENWATVWAGIGGVLADVGTGILRGIQGLVDGFTWMIEKIVEAGNFVGIFSDETEADFKTWRKGVSGAFDDAVDDLQGWKNELAKTPKIVKLEGNIKDLDKKIKDAEKEIKDVPKSKRTAFQGKIDDLKAKRAAAQREIDKLRGKTVKVGLAGLPDINATFEKLKGIGDGSAAGGLIPGPKSNVDNHLRPMATGEFVVRSNKVNPQTLPMLEAINSGRSLGLAKGGVVGKVDFKGSPGLVPIMTTGAQLAQGAINAIASQVKKIFSGLAFTGGGPGLSGALNWALAQRGKPYGWGAVGPGAFDCSGFMSAITNKIRGRNPYSRLGSTATFPWGGFAPGPGRFMIGSTRNAGGGIGHMAGTLLGVNVESRGSDGVVVGSSARGARSSLFGGPWHMQGFAKGGLVGDPPFDNLSRKGLYPWPTEAQDFWRTQLFDSGGWLQPGVTMAVNNTGHPERVMPRGRGGASTIQIVNHGVIGSQHELNNWLVRSLDTLRRQGRMP
jgi:hypothetical protein